MHLTARWRSGPVFVLLLIVALPPMAAAQDSATMPLLWFRDGQATFQARAVLQHLELADREGLDPADYDVAALRRQVVAIESLQLTADPKLTAADRALSAAVQRYVNQLHFGRVDPRRAGFRLQHTRTSLEGADVVARIAVSNDPIADIARFEPPFVHYRLLRDALQRYRELARRPELSALPPLPTRSVRAGERYTGAPRLRDLLRALGDLESQLPIGDPLVVDVDLGLSLQRFQARHNIEPDGVLGRRTMNALRTPLKDRVRQIELTLERLRWTPLLHGPRMIVVNIPAFVLNAYEVREDGVAMRQTMKVIVGKSVDARTPLFDQDLSLIEFSPYWNVPATIARKELVPRLRRDPAHFAREGYEFVGADGRVSTTLTPALLDGVLAGQQRLRQRPGPRNALGDIKFVLPNNDSIYLHHTPSTQLFDRDRRDFSHGCIRLQDPVALALFVLEGQPEWTEERIRAAMAAGKSSTLRLTDPVRVVITYGTAIVRDGRTYFYDDIYGHDRLLDAALRRASAVRSGPATRS